MNSTKNSSTFQPQSFTRPKYRADVDGMRAFAILSVLFFHAYPNVLKGGFIGVDVFFVISGYLISGIIFRGLQHNSFSFFDFYARRVRRIFPAVTVTILGAYILGFFFLTSYELETLIKESPYAAFFLENWRLYLQTGGYWDAGTELKPFMHFWSLGVEEQYYIFYPLICFVLWKFSKKTFLASLLFMFAVSFGLCLYDTSNEPIRAFYSLHSRFWELLVGGILAYVEIQWGDVKSKLSCLVDCYSANFASCLGALLLLIGLVTFKEGENFPGWQALLPTIGAVLIIFAGEKAWLNRFVLSNKIVVFIGLISYPLYLWHWIFICIFRNNLAGELPSGSLMVITIALSFIMAYLTYNFIERPMRSKKATWQLVTVLALLLLVLTLGLKTAIRKSETLQSIVYGGDSVIIAEMIDKIPHVDQKDSTCESKFGDHFTVCRATVDKPEVLMYGDSHLHLMWKYLYKQSNLPGFYIVAGDGTVVFDGVYPRKVEQFVMEEQQRVWEVLRNSPEIRTVVLRGYWSSYNTRDLVSIKYPDLSGTELVQQSWRDLFAELHFLGKNVILVLDNIDVDYDPIKKCLSVQRVSLGEKPGNECIVPYKDILQSQYDVRSFLIEEAKKWDNISVVDSWKTLCNEKGCYLAKDKIPYYQDNDHLSPYGNELLWPLIKSAIDKTNQGVVR